MNTAALAVTVALLLGAGAPDPEPAPKDAAPSETEKKPTVARLVGADPASREEMEPVLLEIAREYKSYVRVSDSAGWAPVLCEAPAPSGVLESASKDASTHGKKLYFLFARDQKDYSAIGWSIFNEKPDGKPFAAAVGQVIVKESFKPVEVADPKDVPPPLRRDQDDPNRGFIPPRELPETYTRDAAGRLYHTGDAAGLFIMAKVAEAEKAGTDKPGTDRGWVYATISADLKQVTSMGRIESCMECHVKAKHDRLFGPKWLQERDTRVQEKEAGRPAEQPAATPKGR
jgi:hypothetical protein